MTSFPILMYHRIEDEAYMHKQGLKLSGEHCSMVRFTRQMNRLKDEFTVLSLPEVVRMISKKEKLPADTAVITFDDGTKDATRIVLPILEYYNFPATFFVMTGPLDGYIPPTFKMQLITGGKVEIEKVAKDFFPKALSEFAPEFADKYKNGINVPKERFIGEKHQSVREMKYLFNYLLPAELKDFVAGHLLDLMFGKGCEEEIAKKMFLDKSDIKHLAHKGMTIGSYTRSHYLLSTVEKKETLRDEIFGSQNTLSLLIGEKPQFFSYPSGAKSSFSPQITEMVKNYYKAAFITGNQRDWCRDDSDIYELTRVHEMHFDK